MNNLKLLMVLVALSGLTIIGCKKGDTGPAGPAGAAGAAGATGATGPAGASGTDSIYHSVWTVLNTPIVNIDSSVTPRDTIYGQQITASLITTAILDSGVVLGYVGVVNGTDTTVFNVTDATIFFGTIAQTYSVGMITLLSAVDYSGVLYRYVIIPGTVIANGYNGKIYTKDELTHMSYSALQSTFHLSSSATSGAH